MRSFTFCRTRGGNGFLNILRDGDEAKRGHLIEVRSGKHVASD